MDKDAGAQFQGPLFVFVVSIAVFFWLGISTRRFWRDFFTKLPGVRKAFVFFATVITPLVIALVVEIADVSKLLSSGVTNVQMAYFHTLAVAIPGYIYLHWISWDFEVSQAEQIEALKRRHSLDVKSLKAKLKVFRSWSYIREHVGESMRTCIGSYAETLKSLLLQAGKDDVQLRSVCNAAKIYDDNLKALVRAIHSACPAAFKYATKPSGKSKIVALLLKEEDGCLVHVQSYDGAVFGCLKDACEAHRETRFRLDGKGSSAGVEAVRSESVVVVADCAKSHGDSNSSFYYFSDHAQGERDTLKSMVAIPIRIVDGERYCLCLSSDREGDFLERRREAYLLLQSEFRERLRLLGLQRSVLGGLTAVH